MKKLNQLKELLNYYNIDGYIVPKNDEFFCEYTSENKDKLKFISNFSGSYGFALILKNKNYLFVDGRYTLQAENESSKLFKILTIPNKLPSDVLKKKKLTIGFDPKLHTHKTLKIFFNKTNCKFLPINQNLIDKLWIKKKTKNPKNKFYVLPKNAIGKSCSLKIKELVNTLNKKKIDVQFITASENIAWLLNIRGQDSNFTPLPNSYMTLSSDKKINLFCDLKKVDTSFRKKLKNIKIIDIKNTDLFLYKITKKKVMIDSSSCSIYFENILRANNKITEFLDPIYFLKSIKSKIEIKNAIKSHIYDGSALTKFLIWIRKNYIKRNINEISAQEKLLKFRKENKNFKFLSFPTISGSGPNGAIIHYKATKKTNRKLKKGDIYLVDSGGQYHFGTTDVTRTISLGNTDPRIKNIFTRVLKGHIAVASYKLTANSIGAKIDSVARQPLRENNLDYAHGTGHGVGCFLHVHEGPHAISKNNKVKFREGMIVSNEPGYYENGKFGIRIENLIRVKKTINGNFFDDLTMVPIDKTLINKNILKKNEINWLNNYHKNVYMNLKKFMNKNELPELSKACSKI
jgi:Xaa-Pro aminopeptidase